MGVILGIGMVLEDVDEVAGTPWIGWHNLVTTGNIISDTEDDGFPATNLANVSTNLYWLGVFNSPTVDEYVTVGINADSSYMGVAKHNFGSAGIAVSVEAWDGNSPPVWVELTSPAVPADDSPIMFRWDLTLYAAVRLRMQPGIAPPLAAVMYVGELLVCERSIDVNVEHVPVTYGRRTHVVNGMSQSGEFLGRIVLGEHRATKAEFKWFNSAWWRANFDPFLEAAKEIPFFWAWSPEEYPAECGYVWLTKDTEPEVDTVTRRVHSTLEMEGVA